LRENENVGGVFLVEKPIQGEAGVLCAFENYLKEAKALCEKTTGCLPINFTLQMKYKTGIARTGRFIALVVIVVVRNKHCSGHTRGKNLIFNFR